MNNSKDSALLTKMQALAKAYTPEWNFTTENPDPGSVVAILISEMLQESVNRYENVLHKHKIQYLNLFDRLKDEPIESARTYVTFTPVTGVQEPVNIPKGTQLSADVNNVAEQVVFETNYGISAINSQLQTVVITDKEQDYIAHAIKKGEDPKTVPFTAFDMTLDSKNEHKLLLGFEDLFTDITNPSILLTLGGASPEEAQEAVEKFCESDIIFGFVEEENFIPFDRCTPSGVSILLEKDNYKPVKTTYSEQNMFFIAIKAQHIPDVKFNGMTVIMAKEDIHADEVYAGDVQQNPEHFHPFGSNMEIYAECGIENSEVYARKGAHVSLSFDLSFTDIEHLMPEYVENQELKIVMRKQREAPAFAKVDIKPDSVLLEYYSISGWKRLIKDEQATLLFNGSVKGEVKLGFEMPQDIISKADYDGNYRIRLRLMRAENLYQIPSVEHVPIMDTLRFAYTYAEKPIKVDFAYMVNNYKTEVVTDMVRNARTVRPFFNSELDKPAMYFGFDMPFWGTPVSMYFDIENHEDFPVDFTTQYLSPNGFNDLKVIDNTKGFRYSDTILAIIPSDIQKSKMFGTEAYWIRFINHNTQQTDANMPTIKSIYSNMVQVQNRRTQTEFFYVEDINSVIRLQLPVGDVIHATIYVNEIASQGGTEENWVRWKKRSYMGEQGRIYDFDSVTGEIWFDKAIFSKYPVDPTQAAVKVDFESYQGSKANVPANTITVLNRSIKYISNVKNPMSAYGGYDGYNEETSASIISNMLRTRSRAVSADDYFDIITQISYGVRRIKCCNGIDQYGEVSDDTITIAVLIEEYNMGGHIFSSIKEQIREKLLQSSSILPLGKSLILSQPYFVRLSLRLWMECDRMENAYDLQRETSELIKTFIDPLTGGFDGDGWEIGTLPTVQQILAFIKIKQPEVTVTRTALTANFGRNEYAVNEEIYTNINNPFAMAVNGEHIIYVDLAPQDPKV